MLGDIKYRWKIIIWFRVQLNKNKSLKEKVENQHERSSMFTSEIITAISPIPEEPPEVIHKNKALISVGYIGLK